MNNSPGKKTESQNLLKKTSLSKKKKCAPKIKPTLPVSLPLSFFHIYLNRTKKEKSSITIDKIETLECEIAKIAKDSTQTDKSNNIPMQCNTSSRDTQTEVSMPNLVPYLHIIQGSGQNKIYENKYCDPATSKSNTMNTAKEKIEKATQTHHEFISNEEKEILRIIKVYDISIDEIKNYHQDMLNNNSQSNHTNLNIIEIKDSDDESKENNQHNEEDLTSPDNNQSNSLSTRTGNLNILMYSNLNKLVFECLYKSINLKQNINDKSAMSKELSQIGQNLVGELSKLIYESNSNRRTIIDVIDLIEESEEVDGETREKEIYMSGEITPVPRKRRATDEPLDLQSNTSKQAKIVGNSLPKETFQAVPLQTSLEQIVPTQTRQELLHRTPVVEHFRPVQSPRQMLETGTMQPSQNRPENMETPQIYQAHQTQSMPEVNPGRSPYQFYRNDQSLPYYFNPVQPNQRLPENSYQPSRPENVYTNNQRPVNIGKQLPTTAHNRKDYQKRLDYLQAYNYLNYVKKTNSNITQFPQNLSLCMHSNSMRFERLLEQQRLQLQQSTYNYHRFPHPSKKNVRY